jgi:probable blue pigment (indigoidine) exporter
MVALLLSALTSGFGNVLGKRTAGRFHPVVLNALPQFYGGLFLSVLALVWEREIPLEWTAASVGSLMYLTLIGSCLVFVLYFWLLRQMATTSVALIALITPITALILGWIILGEQVTPRLAIGAALVATGIALATMGPGRGRSSSTISTDRA